MKNKIFRVQIIAAPSSKTDRQLIQKNVVAHSERDALIAVLEKTGELDPIWQSPELEIQCYEANAPFIL